MTLRHGPLTADMIPLLTAGSSVLRAGKSRLAIYAGLIRFRLSGNFLDSAPLDELSYVGELADTSDPRGWITAPEGGWTENPVPGVTVFADGDGGKTSLHNCLSDVVSDWLGMERFRPAEALSRSPAIGEQGAVAWQIKDRDGWQDFQPTCEAQKDLSKWATLGWEVRALYDHPAPPAVACLPDRALFLKLIDTLKPLAEVAEKLAHCHVVEICEPHPDNPSRNIVPMPREWFERAADDMEAIAILLHRDGTLSEGQASKITRLDRVEARKLADALSAPPGASGVGGFDPFGTGLSEPRIGPARCKGCGAIHPGLCEALVSTAPQPQADMAVAIKAAFSAGYSDGWHRAHEPGAHFDPDFCFAAWEARQAAEALRKLEKADV